MTTALAARASEAARAGLRQIDGRTVSWFVLDGGPHRGAIGTREGEVLERAVSAALDLGVPVVGVLATSGADVAEGVASLHAWGRVAAELGRAGRRRAIAAFSWSAIAERTKAIYDSLT